MLERTERSSKDGDDHVDGLDQALRVSQATIEVGRTPAGPGSANDTT